MRRPLLGLAVALGCSLLGLADRSEAQVVGTGVGSDVFSFYYGYYLPHQAAVAAQPTPMDTLNAVTAARQFTAVTDRAGLYDPISPYGEEDNLEDPLRPYGSQRGGKRQMTTPSFSSNAKGTGPALYYNRVARYYPGLRTGRGPNRNIAQLRTSRGAGAMGMGMGMGGFGGMPSAGPR